MTQAGEIAGEHPAARYCLSTATSWSRIDSFGENPGKSGLEGAAPFKVLTVRYSRTAQGIDFSRSRPVVTKSPNIKDDRLWESLTVLPGGRILATGGSNKYNEDESTGAAVAYQAESFDPNSATWTLGA